MANLSPCLVSLIYTDFIVSGMAIVQMTGNLLLLSLLFFLSLHCRNGPFLKHIHEGGDSVESDVGHSKDPGSFLMSQVTVGYEIESEVRMSKDGKSNLAFDFVTSLD